MKLVIVKHNFFGLLRFIFSLGAIIILIMLPASFIFGRDLLQVTETIGLVGFFMLIVFNIIYYFIPVFKVVGWLEISEDSLNYRAEFNHRQRVVFHEGNIVSFGYTDAGYRNSRYVENFGIKDSRNRDGDLNIITINEMTYHIHLRSKAEWESLKALLGRIEERGTKVKYVVLKGYEIWFLRFILPIKGIKRS